MYTLAFTRGRMVDYCIWTEHATHRGGADGRSHQCRVWYRWIPKVWICMKHYPSSWLHFICIVACGLIYRRRLTWASASHTFNPTWPMGRLVLRAVNATETESTKFVSSQSIFVNVYLIGKRLLLTWCTQYARSDQGYINALNELSREGYEFHPDLLVRFYFMLIADSHLTCMHVS